MPASRHLPLAERLTARVPNRSSRQGPCVSQARGMVGAMQWRRGGARRPTGLPRVLGRRTCRGPGPFRLLVVEALVAAVATACMVPTARLGDLRASHDEDTLPPDYVAPWPGAVLRDVPYGPGERQRVDVYMPAQISPSAPVILYLHAGGWVAGSREPVPPLVSRQVDRMHAIVVSADYTLASADDRTTAFPAASRDVDWAIRWIKAQAPGWGVSSRVLVIGASAGGNLALLAGLAPGRFVDPDLPPRLSTVSPVVSGVVSLAGPVDIAAMYAIPGWRPTVLEPYLGCSPCSPDVVKSADPLTYLGSATPPTYLAYGADDWLIPADVHGLPTAIALMRSRGDHLRDVGERAVWYELVPGGHDIDHAHLNVRFFEIWLDLVAQDRWPGPGA